MTAGEEEEEEEAREVLRPLTGDMEEADGWLEVGKKNKVTATRTTKSRESVMSKIFGGKFRSVLRMPGGAKNSATLEPYQPLQLDIQVFTSLITCRPMLMAFCAARFRTDDRGRVAAHNGT